MPEVLFRVRWPDDAVELCYSPSRVIMSVIDAGQAYEIDDFVARCRDGLNQASERVRARYGGAGCARAMAQLASIEAKAAGLSAANRPVIVEAFA